MEENNIYQIMKRDGTVVLFNRNRIRDAIWKSFRVTAEGDKDRAENLTDQVISIVNHKYSEKHPSVEQIQDIVEEVLILNKYVKTAKAYILYRSQHSQLRDLGHLMKNVEMIDGYLENSDWRIKENANMAYSLQGLNTHISSLIVSQYWMNKIYPTGLADAHKNGDLHIHDLNTLGAYCVGWDLQDLLTSGFTGVRGKIESKPPKHFRTALGQIVNYIYTLQGETAGAQAFSNFDTYLAPFIRYDNLEYDEVKQAMQEFLFNMNVPTRVGFQTPFSNITMDLIPPDFLKDQPVIIGGKTMKETYREFQKEMDLLNLVFTEVMVEGDASGRVFTFPIPTYNITKDFDWESDTAKGIFEMTAKYGIPYFSNFINSDMNPDDARSMCCRLRLDNRELRKRGGGLFGANPLTGSIGVVTINLPRIGYLAKDEEQYFQKLGELMDMAYQSLEAKRKILETFTERGLYPYTKFYLRNIKQANGEYWKNHFATIGLIGLNESILNFMGTDLISEDGRKFGEKVLEFMREKLTFYQQETGNVYNLEATPGEGTTYRIARLDKSRYPNIVVANEKAYKSRKAAPYYTNSSQLDVSTPIDVFDALEAQDGLQTKYTGGTVFHAFLGERLYDWKVAAKLVKTIAENFRLPYFTLSPTFSVCPVHGYIAGEHKYCPKCDEEIGYASAMRMKAQG